MNIKQALDLAQCPPPPPTHNAMVDLAQTLERKIGPNHNLLQVRLTPDTDPALARQNGPHTKVCILCSSPLTSINLRIDGISGEGDITFDKDSSTPQGYKSTSDILNTHPHLPKAVDLCDGDTITKVALVICVLNPDRKEEILKIAQQISERRRLFNNIEVETPKPAST
jgi:hypothetical protein